MGINWPPPDEPGTPGTATKATNGSVIDRPDVKDAPGGNRYADILLMQLANQADDFEPFFGRGRARDRQLRAFWPTESHFASALGTICTRDAAYRYQLEGGPRTVRATQDILENANEGEGWHDLILKTRQDLGWSDNGAAWEIVRDGDSESAPLRAINHLDSLKITHTGDPVTPVIYEDRRGRLHELKWYNVVTFSSMPSPVEAMYGRQMSSMSRILKQAQIIRDIVTYQSEKVGGRDTKAVHFVKGIPTSFIKDALSQSQIEFDNQGRIKFSTVPIVGIPEPEGTLQTATLLLASLPDNFSQEEMMKWYYILLALGFDADPQELAPIQGGSLGSGAQSTTLHLKGQARGAALFRGMITHAMNRKILPKTVEFTYDIQDVDADQADALLVKTRWEGYEIAKRTADLPVEAIRQMAVDDQVISQDLFDTLGELDITEDETVEGSDNPDVPSDDVEPDGTKPLDDDAVLDTDGGAKESAPANPLGSMRRLLRNIRS